MASTDRQHSRGRGSKGCYRDTISACNIPRYVNGCLAIRISRHGWRTEGIAQSRTDANCPILDTYPG
jgi:hypothetical protein